MSWWPGPAKKAGGRFANAMNDPDMVRWLDKSTSPIAIHQWARLFFLLLFFFLLLTWNLIRDDLSPPVWLLSCDLFILPVSGLWCQYRPHVERSVSFESTLILTNWQSTLCLFDRHSSWRDGRVSWRFSFSCLFYPFHWPSGLEQQLPADRPVIIINGALYRTIQD